MSRRRNAAPEAGAGAFVFDPVRVLSTGSPQLQALQAQSIIQQAEEQARAIIERAQSDADAMREDGYRLGYEAGNAQGLSDWEEAIGLLLKQRDQMQKDLERFCRDVEPTLLELAVQIAEKIVRHEVDRNSETVLDIVRLALTQVRDRSNVKIWVNPADLERVRSQREEIAAWVEGLRNVEISGDRRVEAGGVVVESEDGILDARISSQLGEIRRRLKEAA